MQVHSLLHCLYEVLLYADGEDAILYAQAAQLGAELIDDSVARLDSSRIKPMIDRVKEPRGTHIY